MIVLKNEWCVFTGCGTSNRTVILKIAEKKYAEIKNYMMKMMRIIKFNKFSANFRSVLLIPSVQSLQLKSDHSP